MNAAEMQPPEPQGEVIAVPVKKWHNHDAHLKRHYRMMATAEFEALVLTSPEIVRLFDEHTAAHEQVKQQLMAQQMQMMALAQGGPAATAPPEASMPMDQMGEVAKRRAT